MVGIGIEELVGVGTGVAVGVGVGVGWAVGVGVGIGVAVGAGVGIAVGDGLGVAVGSGAAVGSAVLIAVSGEAESGTSVGRGGAVGCWLVEIGDSVATGCWAVVGTVIAVCPGSEQAIRAMSVKITAVNRTLGILGVISRTGRISWLICPGPAGRNAPRSSRRPGR